ncbi:hypothetical protein ElyMa_002815600 [Elysia marginata]|uniref:Uncharacterized protein n=1 Tax=Elysia marginata TaxID=1093978 RepID=A0AAV4HSB6_9GAST|nr:hypothetical protein ElyMa_002815600 [Elysia marginata]
MQEMNNVSSDINGLKDGLKWCDIKPAERFHTPERQTTVACFGQESISMTEREASQTRTHTDRGRLNHEELRNQTKTARECRHRTGTNTS